MELFPAQPDLSLQISPPNTKPTSNSWSREEDVVDLGFWKRALDSRNSISSSMAAKPNNNNNNTACFDLSLSNSRLSESNSNQNIHHHHLQNTNGNLFHTYHQNQNHHHHQLHHHQLFHHHHQQQQGGLTQELGFLRPIRGIPVYQNPHTPPHPSFPFSAQLPLDTTCLSSSINMNVDSSATPTTTTTRTTSTPFFQSSSTTHQGLMRSRFLSRFPAKRSMRAPRMRWTTTLHARFVHAVELLGGHESKLFFFFFFFPL